MLKDVVVVGGGLAGSEAAWQLAQRGFQVKLYEMRPVMTTGAHVSNHLAELVCSNSLGSKLPDRASGLLQAELNMLGSMLMDCAMKTAIPAGGALAVDRESFARLVTETIESHSNIDLIRGEVQSVPTAPSVIATGPLTSKTLASDLVRLTGQEYLYFYDAIAPIITTESIDMNIAFQGSRYGRGSDDMGDYINCPMNQAEYDEFVDAVLNAPRTELRDFERDDPHFFEGCLPIEQLAARGRNTLAFGPMRPTGLRDPRTGNRPHAIVQLRRDNLAGSLYNIVGFQTNIRWGEQERILRLIPGLAQAEFVRLGQMHRNTFVNAPALLDPTMQLRSHPGIFLAGQLTGVEGYAGNIATGLVAGLNLARLLAGEAEWIAPDTTMLGALCHYVTQSEPENFQPMKANFGIMPDLSHHVKAKRDRAAEYARRAIHDMQLSIDALADPALAFQKSAP
ncbi:MAG: methylenetetrahydrofolate--tRNA-(uracil(54)-C(5))-methyltransferase (FADH(2)-oxidizing) TrmFO [Chloroflexota bacterium]